MKLKPFLYVFPPENNEDKKYNIVAITCANKYYDPTLSLLISQQSRCWAYTDTLNITSCLFFLFKNK